MRAQLSARSTRTKVRVGTHQAWEARVVNDTRPLLIAEDQEFVFKLLRRYIQARFGERPVVHAIAGQEAMELFASRGDWGGVMVDPGLTDGKRAGIKFLQWMRERNERVPVIVVTEQHDPDLVALAQVLDYRLVWKAPTEEQFQLFFDKCSVYGHTRRDAVLKRARERYKWTPTETELVGWFLDRGDRSQWLATKGRSTSRYNELRLSILAVTGDEDLERLAIRLWAEAADEIVR